MQASPPFYHAIMAQFCPSIVLLECSLRGAYFQQNVSNRIQFSLFPHAAYVAHSEARVALSAQPNDSTGWGRKNTKKKNGDRSTSR